MEAEARQQKHKTTKDLLKDISRLEEKISEYENELKDLESKLTDPQIYSDGEKAKKVTGKFNRAKHDLDSAIKKWEELNEKLIAIESQFN